MDRGTMKLAADSGTGRALSPPTGRLLVGLATTLIAVCVFSLYALQQIQQLKDLQTETIDRDRRDSLQLLRIQEDLHSIAMAMRDMLEGDEPYELEAWKGQMERIRADLEDALRLESRLAPAGRTPERQLYLHKSLAQFWTSVGQMFALAREGRNDQARTLIRNSLQPQQAAIAGTVARLLVQNNEFEEQETAKIQAIYLRAERNVYYFLAAMLATISLISLYLIYVNRRIFARLANLSAHTSELARRLISMQEEVLRSISRELHDEFGQILTAVGAMLGRAGRHQMPAELHGELEEVRQITQAALEQTRSLSQALHPSILDDGGLEKALEWYLPVFEKQTGITVRYEKTGVSPELADGIAIHVYRVAQEALNNVARHSKAPLAWVRLRFDPGRLCLEVEDRGVGLPADEELGTRGGIGLVGIRERAALLQGKVEFARPGEGGTLVRLDIPLSGEGSA